ncbi:MAG: hypothetical protein ASARMPRED_005383 [Alectoria sarmentosa]|nr:MAG: hypothetical protein ASARMPRED_005383 [Alectoria sarmentosa]
MPPRRKKELRDSILTHSFFNQGVCPCCSGRTHNHNTSSLKPDDPNYNKLAEFGPDYEKLSSVMTSSWMVKYNTLTPQEREKLHASIAMSPTIKNPKAVMQALTLAQKQMNDEPTMADDFPPMETFDLDNLDEVAKTYDGLCKGYKDEEERGMADLAGLVSNLAVTASDANRSPEDRLAAELDMHNLNIHSKITLPLTSCLRQVQLFNIEKKFGCVEESYQALCNDDKKRRGEDVPAEMPQSFRQKWNDPFKLVEAAPKPRKKKAKKRLGVDEALVELKRNCKLAMEEMQDLKKVISDAEKPIVLPSVPASFTYADVPVPEDLPDHIRQRFFDAEFAFNEVVVLQEKASQQLLKVRGVFVAWYSTNDEAWEFGKTRIHEMPVFREYEYTRNELHSLFYVAARQEVKIVEFYSSEGAPKLPQAMNTALKLNSLSPKEFEEYWELRCLKLQQTIPSVDKMLAEIDVMLKETAEEDHPKIEWWKWLVDDSQ